MSEENAVWLSTGDVCYADASQTKHLSRAGNDPNAPMTQYEFDHITQNPELLKKTTFFKGKEQYDWNGKDFVKR